MKMKTTNINFLLKLYFFIYTSKKQQLNKDIHSKRIFWEVYNSYFVVSSLQYVYLTRTNLVLLPPKLANGPKKQSSILFLERQMLRRNVTYVTAQCLPSLTMGKVPYARTTIWPRRLDSTFLEENIPKYTIM